MIVRVLLVLLVCAVAGNTEDFQKLFDAAKGSPTTGSPTTAKSLPEPVHIPAGGASFSAVLLSECFDGESRTAGSDLDKQCKLLEAAAFQQALGTYQYQHNLYAWQQTSSKVLFWIVVALVSSGMFFAGLQFARAFRTQEPVTVHGRKSLGVVAATAVHAAVPEEESSSTSNLDDLAVHLDVSAKGVQVSSSVLGVIILVISLAFLYLYLHNVYPIVPAGTALK